MATGKADLSKVPLGSDPDSWVLCSDGYLRHNKEELHHITQIPQEGDTIVNPTVHLKLSLALTFPIDRASVITTLS